jgi:SAM-dependent methyltransferase
MASREEMARSFGAEASAYEAARPEYPLEAVAWMLEPVRAAGRAPRVADVGAGTGKLTRRLVALGADAVAVDPDAGMRAELARRVPGVPVLEGTAEALPLDDASCDAVVLGQAWHWVEPEAGCREIARVLRPGGVLGLAWNQRDTTVPWVARLREVTGASNAELLLEADGPAVTAPFPALERREWRWRSTITREGLADLTRSRSRVITADPAERDRVARALDALSDEIGATGDAAVPLPYVTVAFRTRRP